MKSFLLLVCLSALTATIMGKGLFKPRATCTPTVCDNTNGCFCSGIEHPAADTITASEVPQMVFLTFDDGINVRNIKIYQEIFETGRTNPNGAKITGTFFVTHENNDYNLTHEVWEAGHEIALHSITHKSNSDYWRTLDKDGYIKEVVEQRDQLAYFAKIDPDTIKGFRSPFLQGSGDPMYEALYENGFQYESTRPTRTLRPVLWPYTADYDTIQDCQIAPCPTGAYPGFWVHPLVDLIDDTGNPCAFVDTCLPVPTDAAATKALLLRNFNDHYNGNRAPFGLYMHAGWITNTEDPDADSPVRTGYLDFIDEILAKNDVYIISITKAFDWMNNPVKALDLEVTPGLLPTWEDNFPTTPVCSFVFPCHFTADQLPTELKPGERYMQSCQPCPPHYPWYGNSLGSDPNTK